MWDKWICILKKSFKFQSYTKKSVIFISSPSLLPSYPLSHSLPTSILPLPVKNRVFNTLLVCSNFTWCCGLGTGISISILLDSVFSSLLITLIYRTSLSSFSIFLSGRMPQHDLLTPIDFISAIKFLLCNISFLFSQSSTLR